VGEQAEEEGAERDGISEGPKGDEKRRGRRDAERGRRQRRKVRKKERGETE
jgi:hypothetical protein